MDEEELQDFQPGEFSDLDDSQAELFDDEDGEGEDGFEEEGFEEFDDEEEDELIGTSERRKKDAPEAKEIIVDEKFYNRLIKQLETNAGAGAIKLFLQVFSDLALEQKKQSQRKRKFVAHELQLIDQLVRFTIEEFPDLLKRIVGFE